MSFRKVYLVCAIVAVLLTWGWYRVLSSRNGGGSNGVDDEQA
jgi:hypothetical protein